MEEIKIETVREIKIEPVDSIYFDYYPPFSVCCSGLLVSKHVTIFEFTNEFSSFFSELLKGHGQKK